MGLFRRLENRVEKTFEGGFGKAFKSNVQPVELARKLAREMDDSKTISVSRVYVPNIYTVYLSPKDREQFATYEASLRTELAGYLAEHARRQGYTVPGKLRVLLETAAELKIGTFGIAVLLSEDPVLPEEQVSRGGSRRVQRAPGQTAPAARDAAPPRDDAPPVAPVAPPLPEPPVAAPSVAAAPIALPPEFGDGEVHVPAGDLAGDAPSLEPESGSALETPERPDPAAYDFEADDPAPQAPVAEVAAPAVVAPSGGEPSQPSEPSTSWALSWAGGSYVVDRRAIVIGRSHDCDVVLHDGNVSRRHAELIRQSAMFLIRDLDSTNGVAVNGRRVREAAVAAGDVITIGATTITLERKR